jgi:hypothetical protein
MERFGNKNFTGGIIMKKFNKALALFLSLLMIFSVFNVVTMADDDETTTEETTVEEPTTEEETTSSVIVVGSWAELKFTVFFKIIEKIFLYIEQLLDKLFGKDTTEEPTTEEPTSEEPTSEEPTSEEPTSEEPTSEEPTQEEPTEEETTEELPSAA